MTRWTLIAEQNVGRGNARCWAAEVLGEVTGTREEAMTALWSHVRHYRPAHPLSVRRKVVLRETDGYLVLHRGATRDYPCRFRACEVVWDSAAP